MAAKSKDTYYLISYREPKDGQIVTLKARQVTDSSLGLSFIAISDFVFNTGSLVVNPAEEDQKRRYEAVKTLHLSIYTIMSIEEIGQGNRGLRFKKDKSNLLVLPSTQPSPKGGQ